MMNKQTFLNHLTRMEACPAALDYVRDHPSEDAKEIWDSCSNHNWKGWLVRKLGPLDAIWVDYLAMKETLWAEYKAKREALDADYLAKKELLYADYRAKVDPIQADYKAQVYAMFNPLFPWTLVEQALKETPK